MKCQYNLFFVKIFLFFSVSVYSTAPTCEEKTIVKINASEYKNQYFKFNSPFWGTTVELNQAGEGFIVLPVNKMLFTELILSENKTIPLFIKPGDEISLKIEKEKFFFTGKGADPNNYLVNAFSFLEQLRDSIRIAINDSPEKFIAVCNAFEFKFNAFHKNFSDSVSFSREVSYLLQNEIYVMELYEKQNYLSMFSMREVDSLNLENRLGIADKKFYHDTVLMHAGSTDLRTLLFTNLDFEMKKIFDPEKMEKSLYPILSTAFIEESQRYGTSIKEFLLFTNLTVMIQSLGITPEIDSIAQKLRKNYPASEYLPRLLSCYTEFEYLLPGKEAPDFSSVAFDKKNYSLRDFRGKVVLIDVWATWCNPCIKSFPAVQSLQEVFKGKPLILLFIAHDRDEKKWKTFLGSYKNLNGIHFRIPDSPFYDAYKITGLPRYILIDKEGKIVNAFATSANEKLRSAIDSLLK